MVFKRIDYANYRQGLRYQTDYNEYFLLISIPFQIFNLHIMIEWMFDKYLMKTQLHKNDNASTERIAMC